MPQPLTAAVRYLSGEREPVRVATTENISLQGIFVVDDVELEVGDRVLVKNQTDQKQNGIYLASEGVWFRAPDASYTRSINQGVTVAVQEGTAGNGKTFRFASANPVVGTDPIVLTYFLSDSLADDVIAEITPIKDAAEAAADRAEDAADHVEAIIGFAGLADEPTVKAGTSTVRAPSVLTLVQRLKYDGYLSVRHFGVKLDGTDESTAWTAALANSVPLKVPAIGAVIPIYQPLQIAQVGGLIGDGEATVFERRFSGGAVVEYGGGEPIILRDFAIRSAAGQSVLTNDHGVRIGFTSPWAQRGDIQNLFITAQWNGFRWKGGTEGDIKNVRCIENKGSGFVGVDPRGRLVSCLSQKNGQALSNGDGSAYLVAFQTVGETGIQLVDCGTFANFEYGLYVSGSVAGANVTVIRGGSSFDRLGGIRVGDSTLTQFYMRGSFVEYAGFANQFVPAFNVQPAAKGVTLGSGLSISEISDLTCLHNKGDGLQVAGAADVTISNSRFSLNGQGGTGTGLSVTSASTNIEMTDIIAKSNATADIGIAAGATGSLKGARAVNISIPANPTFVSSGVDTSPAAISTIAAANVLSLPNFGDLIRVTGSTAINAISASYPNRRVTLVFQNSVSVGNGNNVFLAGSAGTSFSATPTDTLTLMCDGTNWFEIGRSVNRDS